MHALSLVLSLSEQVNHPFIGRHPCPYNNIDELVLVLSHIYFSDTALTDISFKLFPQIPLVSHRPTAIGDWDAHRPSGHVRVERPHLGAQALVHLPPRHPAGGPSRPWWGL